MEKFTVMLNIAFIVDATDEVDALTQAKAMAQADGSVRSANVMRGEQHFG